MPIGTNTLAVILGASEWPTYPTLDSSPAFKASAEQFRDYLISKKGVGIPTDNLKYLFDIDFQPGPLLTEVRDFLSDRIAKNPRISDIIFYYVGHGGYLREREYFLAIKSTSKVSKEATIFRISYLRDIISDITISKRNLVILDACYSGGALAEFAHQADDDAAVLVKEQVYEGLPSGGTVLFCAAGPKKWAKTPLEAQFTMFSGAMFEILEKGNPAAGPYISLNKLSELVDDNIKRTFGGQGVKPQIHVPVQLNEQIAKEGYFPNPGYSLTDLEGRLGVLETSLRELGGNVGKIQLALQRAESQVKSVTETQPLVVDERAKKEDAASLLRKVGGLTIDPEEIMYHYRQNVRRGASVAMMAVLILGRTLAMPMIGAFVEQDKDIFTAYAAITASATLILIILLEALTRGLFVYEGIDRSASEFQEIKLRKPDLSEALKAEYYDVALVGRVPVGIYRVTVVVASSAVVIAAAFLIRTLNLPISTA